MQLKKRQTRTLKAGDWFPDPAFPFRAERVSISGPHRAHRHEFFEFFLVVDGRLRHSIDTRGATIGAGDLVLLNPARAHSFVQVPDGPVTQLQVLFLPSFLALDRQFMRRQKSLMELVYLEPFYQEGCLVFRLVGKTRLKVQALMEELVDEFRHRPRGYEVSIRAKLTDLLITVARAYDQEKRKRPQPAKRTPGTADAIINSLAYIEEHCTEPLPLADVAALAGVTREYFSQVFHKINGVPFSAHLAALRVERARKLLADTDEKIITVCFEAGFRDVSHFNSTFRKLAGTTPSEYRRRCRGNGG